MAAFRLLDLPMELVIAVSAQVDEQTLFDFKLACKRTFYACEPFFINANFGDLSFNFTTHSLKVLRHIADEPRFHPHLKLLWVVTCHRRKSTLLTSVLKGASRRSS